MTVDVRTVRGEADWFKEEREVRELEGEQPGGPRRFGRFFHCVRLYLSIRTLPCLPSCLGKSTCLVVRLFPAELANGG